MKVFFLRNIVFLLYRTAFFCTCCICVRNNLLSYMEWNLMAIRPYTKWQPRANMRDTIFSLPSIEMSLMKVFRRLSMLLTMSNALR